MQADDLLVSPANFSEGGDLRLIGKIAAGGSKGCRLLDIHADPDHNRSVVTFAGAAGVLAEGLFAAAATAVELIDIRVHSGVHPRFGSVDVVPFVPYGATPMGAAVDAALTLARRLGDELGLPCFLYGDAGPRSLPEIRKNAFRSLDPEFGPLRPHPTAGACAVGARGVLVAYNVNLDTTDVSVARAIAAALREMPHLRALGFMLRSAGVAQVSCNLLEPARTTIADVFDAVSALAAERGVEVLESELVGLAPRSAFAGRDPAALKFSRNPSILEDAVGF